MRDQEHHYEIYETSKGFIISPSEENRPELAITIDEYGFWHIHGKLNYPLYSFYDLVNASVEALYNTWVSPKGNNYRSPVFFKIKRWAQTITSKTLNPVIYRIWEERVQSTDPLVRELHRKLYSVSRGTGRWTSLTRVLENKLAFKYLIADLLNYPAARIAFLHSNVPSYNWSPEWDWKKVYAKDEEVYTSLLKTLMNLPGGVTYYKIFGLKGIKLPEPAITRLRLWAYCSVDDQLYRKDDEKEALMEVIKRSSDEDIKKAICYIWRYFPTYTTGDFRKSSGISHAFRMIFDYPARSIGKWDIVGLAKRAEKYHHDTEAREAEMRARWEEQNRQRDLEHAKKMERLLASSTAMPPVALPDDDKIKFLDSYKAILDEETLMEHCIADYAERAVEGQCYLFHVDYKGEMASIQVSPEGYVVQSYGPQDKTNKASEYARKTLGKWAKQLRRKTD